MPGVRGRIRVRGGLQSPAGSTIFARLQWPRGAAGSYNDRFLGWDDRLSRAGGLDDPPRATGRGRPQVSGRVIAMTMTAEEKKQIVGDFKLHDKDTGSPEVQIALLTQRINSSGGTSMPTRRTTRPAAGC